MKTKNVILLVMVAHFVMCLASTASATWLCTGILSGQQESDSIYLNTIGGNVAYTSSTDTTVGYVNGFDNDALVTGSAWAITGAYGSSSPPDYPYTYVETATGSTDGLPSGTVGVGRTAGGNTPSYLSGAVLWHVVAPTGKVFSGGTAVLSASVEADYGRIWPACNTKYEWRLFDVAPTIGYNSYSVPVGTYQTALFDGTVAYQTKDLTLNIPAGLSEFWVAFDSMGTSDRYTTAYFDTLTISGTIVAHPVRVEVENLMGTYAFDYGTEYLDGESACIGYPVYGGTEGKVMLPNGASTWYAWISYYSNNNARDLDVTLNGATTYFHDTYNLWQWQRIGTVNSGEVDINLVSSGTMPSAADSIIFTPFSTFDPNTMTIAQLSAITEIPRTKEFAEQWLIDNPSGTTAAWVEAVRAHYGYPSGSRTVPIDSYGNVTYEGNPVFPLLLNGRDTTGTALNTCFGWPDGTWQDYGMENFYYGWGDYDHWAKNYNRSVDPMGGRPNAPVNYIIDEPENIGLSDIMCERLNDLVNMMDPNVATLINVSPSYVTRDSVLTIPDVVSLDRYPIDHYTETIAENAYCFDCLRYYSDIRPAMFIAQAWQWTAESSWPTTAEERAMSYLALAQNARGLMWFQWPTPSGGTIASDNPALWADMQVMFSEISQIVPCLQGPEIFQPYTATVINPMGGSAAEFRVAVSANRTQAVLIAVNPYQGGDWPVTVRLDFRGGPLTDASLASTFTGQTASVSQLITGVWDVTFASGPASGVFTLTSSHLGSLTQMTKTQVTDMLGARLNVDTPPQRLNYCNCNNAINITAAGETWSTTFNNNLTDFMNSIYAVGGGSQDNIACVYWQPGNIQLCEYNWQYGSIFWKLHTAKTQFERGKVSLTFNYSQAMSGRFRGYVGVGTSAPTVNLTWGTVTWTPSQTVDIWGDYTGLDAFGTLPRTVTLDIPAGQDIYFGVKCGDTPSDVIYLQSMSVKTSLLRRLEGESFPSVTKVTDNTCVAGKYALITTTERSLTKTLPSNSSTYPWYVWVRYYDNGDQGLRVTLNGTQTTMPSTGAVFTYRLVGTLPTNTTSITTKLMQVGVSHALVDTLIYTSDPDYNPNNEVLADWNAITAL